MRAFGVVAVVVAACGGHAVEPPLPSPHPPRLLAPPPVDLRVRGAAYLADVSQSLQPPWAQFVEDCRVRLPPGHPLNVSTLVAIADLAVDPEGQVVDVRIATSGNAEFDLAVRELIAEASHLARPPIELWSDDDRVHLRWTFARDRRQAGPATAEVVSVKLPVLQVTDRLLAAGEVVRAAQRVASVSATDPDRLVATERVMVAALGEALAAGGARPPAVQAIGRAGVHSLAPGVRALLAPTIDSDLRVLAIEAVAALGDDAAVPALRAQLPLDLPAHPRLAVAETAALVALGHRDDAAAAIRAILEDRDALKVVALEAHALAPSLQVQPMLATWFQRALRDGARDALLRAAVCAAIAVDQPDFALISRGLHDADARVRASCVDAAARVFRPIVLARRASGKPALSSAELRSPDQRAIVRRLSELGSDRDARVRARAIDAVGLLDPTRRTRATVDPAPEVRIAAIRTASDPELRGLTEDPDPDVRAAAIAVLADRAPELVLRATRDPAPQVRRAALAAVDDDDTLQRLVHDASGEVATAALVRLTSRRGRAAMTGPLLAELAAAAPASVERVRIALAWLLGP